MSIHSSLRGVDTLKGERSVFSRVERLAILKKEGRFDEKSGSIYGLPKVRTRFKVAGGAKKKAKEEKPAAGGAVAATPAAPAAAAAKGGDKKAEKKK